QRPAAHAGPAQAAGLVGTRGAPERKVEVQLVALAAGQASGPGGCRADPALDARTNRASHPVDGAGLGSCRGAAHRRVWRGDPERTEREDAVDGLDPPDVVATLEPQFLRGRDLDVDAQDEHERLKGAEWVDEGCRRRRTVGVIAMVDHREV